MVFELGALGLYMSWIGYSCKAIVEHFTDLKHINLMKAGLSSRNIVCSKYITLLVRVLRLLMVSKYFKAIRTCRRFPMYLALRSTTNALALYRGYFPTKGRDFKVTLDPKRGRVSNP